MMLIILFSILSVSIEAVNNESIIYVDDDNSNGPWDGSVEHPYQYIQDAIQGASPYDTIFVFEGVYYERIFIDKALSLIGEQDQYTIIDAEQKGSAIIIDDVDSIRITNFTIAHGSKPTSEYGYGIMVNSSNDICITSNIITDNECGIVIQKESKDCLIIDNEITNNELGFDLCTSYKNLVFENNFQSNVRSLILYNTENNYISNNVFNDGNQPVTFFNSMDSIQENYWGSSKSIHVIFGYRSIFGSNLYIPWFRCDFKAVSTAESIESCPIAVMKTNKGTMMFELYTSKTPVTASNFMKLSSIDFFENIVFHRVIDDFVIQGGGYYANGTYVESPFGTIDLEIHPDVRHVDGAISMARTNDPNSATSQFFICDGAQPHLDDNYAAFGTLLVGFDVLDSISSVETTTKNGFMRDWPVDDIIIHGVDILNE